MYGYYPGCSLSGTAKEYDVSTRAIFKELGAELAEIPDWTCCGASAVESVDRDLAMLLPARNLALAEQRLDVDDILIPCSGCYLNLLNADQKARSDKEAMRAINQGLALEGLSYAGRIRPRHILDILLNDLGPDRIADRVARGFDDLLIAPYYGCQALRPYPVFDDPERPSSMTPLLHAIGARTLDWDMGGKCCGASLMTTHKDMALKLVAVILGEVGEADAVVTVCPMCQMNLESFQVQAFQVSGQKEFVSILYLPQLLGLAMGLPEESILLGKNMMVTEGVRKKLQGAFALPA